MSQDQASNRKEKKAQRDAERKKKGKKRKHEDLEEEEQHDEPQNAKEVERDFIPLDEGADAAEPVDATKSAGTSSAPKKKRRKKSKAESIPAGADAPEKTKSRFILFVGNLPFNTTDSSLQTHFKKLAPFTLRHRTDPKTKKSKGFAFLEFEDYDRLKTCLKLYHHSMFDPAKADGEIDAEVATADSKKGSKGGRKINVELTAGGGGKTEGRREKIKQKNVRLDEQRKRRAEFERSEREKSKGEAPSKKEGAAGGGGGSGAEENAGMHPSRLARMQT